MASIGDTTRPAFAYDQATDTWVPVGVGPHSHTPAAIGAISSSLVTAKGDLIVGTSSGVVVAQPVGTNGQVLTADSTQADGVIWSTPTGMSNPMTTTGDIIYSSSGSTPARRAIGTTGQVLTVSGGVPTWATASSGGITLISTTTMTGSSQVNLTSIPSTYKSLRLVITAVRPSSAAGYLRFLFNNDTTNPGYATMPSPNARHTSYNINSFGSPYIDTYYTQNGSNSGNIVIMDIPDYTSNTNKYAEVRGLVRQPSASTYDWGIIPAFWNSTSVISQINIYYGGDTFGAGTAYLYGVN